jgi:hypothetical protein
MNSRYRASRESDPDRQADHDLPHNKVAGARFAMREQMSVSALGVTKDEREPGSQKA